ncbi:hypothetical protein Dimus_036081, partial [Dionaea muscipula]
GVGRARQRGEDDTIGGSMLAASMAGSTYHRCRWSGGASGRLPWSTSMVGRPRQGEKMMVEQGSATKGATRLRRRQGTEGQAASMGGYRKTTTMGFHGWGRRLHGLAGMNMMKMAATLGVN